MNGETCHKIHCTTALPNVTPSVVARSRSHLLVHPSYRPSYRHPAVPTCSLGKPGPIIGSAATGAARSAVGGSFQTCLAEHRARARSQLVPSARRIVVQQQCNASFRGSICTPPRSASMSTRSHQGCQGGFLSAATRLQRKSLQSDQKPVGARSKRSTVRRPFSQAVLYARDAHSLRLTAQSTASIGCNPRLEAHSE